MLRSIGHLKLRTGSAHQDPRTVLTLCLDLVVVVVVVVLLLLVVVVLLLVVAVVVVLLLLLVVVVVVVVSPLCIMKWERLFVLAVLEVQLSLGSRAWLDTYSMAGRPSELADDRCFF